MKYFQNMKKSHKIVVGVCCVILIFLGLWKLWELAPAGVYSSSTSPDGQFKIVVYRKLVFPFMFPGQSGDAPGYVRLLDTHGKVLKEKDVDMVQSIDHDNIIWEKDSVFIFYFAEEWYLPPTE